MKISHRGTESTGDTEIVKKKIGFLFPLLSVLSTPVRGLLLGFLLPFVMVRGKILGLPLPSVSSVCSVRGLHKKVYIFGVFNI